ncbi:hypothetical protein BBJ28_00003876 [Nothophytophthora sp. Chile5]|nr:hypothetical protein BBJ28_00003876 [Nothophytophthora sp. Chile5]
MPPPTSRKPQNSQKSNQRPSNLQTNMPAPQVELAADERVFSPQEEDARLNERISKARSELSELHKFMGGEGPAMRTRSRTTGTSSGTQQQQQGVGYDPLPLGMGFHTPQPLRSASGERLLQLSRTEEAIRSDRMRLAELSDEKLGAHKWNASAKAAPTSGGGVRMSPVGRIRANTTPRRTTAKDLRDYSTDFVQQALDFNDIDADEEEGTGDAPTPSPSPPRRLGGSLGMPGDGAHTYEGEFGGARSHQDLRTYVRQMEETIAQLVQQKDELLRNQAEFDKHASGIFPSLENLNHQLSQIVQGKMLQSEQSQNNEDAERVHEDMLDELRVQREQLSELEADSKRRKYDSELQEQDRAIELSQIKGDIISLVASGKMRDERAELHTDTVKKLEHELQDAMKSMVQRYQLLDKRINQLQTPMAQPRLVVRCV